MSIFTNLTKACIGVIAAPVMVMADVLTLPSSAMDGRGPFDRTAKTLGAAGDALAEAIKPERGQP
jgi:hypothetical protein